MSKYARLRIHIAPLGFESDRIVMPAIEKKADKVWVLIHNDQKKTKAKSYLDDIKVRLRKERIECETKELDRLDLFSVIKGVRSITDEEGNDNTFYVNVSSGSKIQAVACTMACMMFNDRNNLIPYYVQPKDYFEYKGEQMSTGMEKIIDIPQYTIKTPDEKLIKALRIIKKNKNRISKKNFAVAAEEEKIIEVGSEENFEQARFTSLNKNIVQSLKNNWGFIREEKIGRTRWIEITADGENVLKILD